MKIIDDDMTEINQMIRALATARANMAAAKSDQASMQEQMQQTAEWQQAASMLETAKAEISALETEIKENAAAGKGAQNHPAVTTRNETMYEYNLDDAIEWCKDHFPLALKLDEKSFVGLKKIKNIEFPTFVKIIEVKRARIAQDLSKYLE